MKVNDADNVSYMGFNSYGVHHVATKKPGLGEYYAKDVFKDICDYNKRKVPFYDDKIRYDSIYRTDYIKNIKEEDYKNGPDQTIKSELEKYNYSHDPNLVQMVTDKPLWKSEDFTRSKFGDTTENDPNRKKVFSNWNSIYNYNNNLTEDLKNSKNFKRSEIDDHFRNRYHRYHCVSYKTEHRDTMGIDGDIPFEKYFIDDQPKFHNDNYSIGLGTTKPTNFIPKYSGFIPTNKTELRYDKLKDPYFNINKTNHLLNYNHRLPRYQGYIPETSSNLKGNTRPFCLSTREEAFC